MSTDALSSKLTQKKKIGYIKFPCEASSWTANERFALLLDNLKQVSRIFSHYNWEKCPMGKQIIFFLISLERILNACLKFDLGLNDLSYTEDMFYFQGISQSRIQPGEQQSLVMKIWGISLSQGGKEAHNRPATDVWKILMLNFVGKTLLFDCCLFI